MSLLKTKNKFSAIYQMDVLIYLCRQWKVLYSALFCLIVLPLDWDQFWVTNKKPNSFTNPPNFALPSFSHSLILPCYAFIYGRIALIFPNPLFFTSFYRYDCKGFACQSEGNVWKTRCQQQDHLAWFERTEIKRSNWTHWQWFHRWMEDLQEKVITSSPRFACEMKIL